MRRIPLVLWELMNMITALSLPGLRFDIDTHPPTGQTGPNLRKHDHIGYLQISVGVNRLFLLSR